MGHLDVSGVSFALPDGRPLLADVTFRVGQGSVTALIGPNGTGKTTLLRIITGDLAADDGVVTRTGGLGVMPQFIGSVRDDSTVRDLLLAVCRAGHPGGRRDAGRRRAADDDRRRRRRPRWPTRTPWPTGATWAGTTRRPFFDVATVAALGVPYDRAKFRAVTSLSGGEQKRLVLELLLAGPDDVLLLDEPDNYLDVPTKIWLEDRLAETDKAVLFVSHDRELLARARDPDRHPRTGRGRRGVLGARRVVRHLSPGPRGPELPAGGTAPALGRAARQAQGTGAHAADQGRLQRRAWPPATRRRRPGWPSSRRPGRRRRCR